MEEWHSKWKRLNDYIEDIKDLHYEPEEWNECYLSGYVKMPFTLENYNLIQYELAEKQMEMLKEKDQIKFNLITQVLTEFMFITIRPDPVKNISVKFLYDKVMKLLKSKYILDYLLVFEQAGDELENIGKGIHIHFIIKNKYRKYSELKKHLINTFSEISDRLDVAINIKNCKHSTDVSNRIEYMTGKKEGEDKQKKQEIDKVWRQRWNIEDFYGNINIG